MSFVGPRIAAQPGRGLAFRQIQGQNVVEQGSQLHQRRIDFFQPGQHPFPGRAAPGFIQTLGQAIQ